MSDSVKVAGIVIARLDSVRLPGKALKMIAGQPLIGWVISRAQRVCGISDLVLATTARAVDDPLADYARCRGIGVFRGELDHVARRCLRCATDLGADYFVRLNGDSPFLEPDLIDLAIQHVTQDPSVDLVTNLGTRSYPYGVAVEVVRTHRFRDVVGAMTPEQAEHVTQPYYREPEVFSICHLPLCVPDLSSTRLVVDTVADFETFQTVAHVLGQDISQLDFRTVAKILPTL